MTGPPLVLLAVLVPVRLHAAQESRPPDLPSRFADGRAMSSSPPAHEDSSFAAPPDSAAELVVSPRVLVGVGEVFLINLLVNRYNAWIREDEGADVAFGDWTTNLGTGWAWDDNAFHMNMFMHPYHGSLYYNAGRSNGLGYWESTALSLLGSWTWEHFGETHQPSANDLLATSLGGATLGETFYRLATAIRDDRATGADRLFREVAAAPLDPVGAFNRLVRGEWGATGPNPERRDPAAMLVRLRAGARIATDSGFVDGWGVGGTARPTFQLDLLYGDPLSDRGSRPFDVFGLRAELDPGAGGLTDVRVGGRLYGDALGSSENGNAHVFAVNQRFDYLDNPAHQFGAQSVETGVVSRWRLGKRNSLGTQVMADVILLAALDAPYSGTGRREYDFGPGGGFRLLAAYERDGISYLRLEGRMEYIHTVSGADADHHVRFGALDASVPLWNGLGVGGQIAYYHRVSRYPERPREERAFPQFRLYAEWSGSSLSAFE